MVVDLTVAASGVGAAAGVGGFVPEVLEAEALVVLVTPDEVEVAAALSVAGAETSAVVAVVVAVVVVAAN